jgi:N-acetylglutamate synthase-like GNAT family acetyltransferase
MQEWPALERVFRGACRASGCLSPQPSSKVSPLRIREACFADAPALAALVSELGHPATSEQIAARLAAQPGDVVLLAEGNGQVLGMAALHVHQSLEHAEPLAQLTALAVHTFARGRGVGRTLLEEAERRASDAGCARLLVLSGQGRPDAHGYYRHLGFEERTKAFTRLLR